MLRHSPQLIEPDKEENAKRRQRHYWRPRRSARPHGGLGRHEGRRLSRDGALDHDRATGQSAATAGCRPLAEEARGGRAELGRETCSASFWPRGGGQPLPSRSVRGSKGHSATACQRHRKNKRTTVHLNSRSPISRSPRCPPYIYLAPSAVRSVGPRPAAAPARAGARAPDALSEP